MEEVLKTEIIRETDSIYFVKGNPLVIFKSKRGRRKKEQEINNEQIM
jgi:hypothetical protein